MDGTFRDVLTGATFRRSNPIRNPWLTPLITYFTNSLSGCAARAFCHSSTLSGVVIAVAVAGSEVGSMLVHDSNACRSLMYESEVLGVHEGMLLSVSSDWYSHNSAISLCLHMHESILLPQ